MFDNFIIDKFTGVQGWAKVPPLQGNEKLWSRIIENNIPTKIDDKTGCLVYLVMDVNYEKENK